MDWCPKEGWKGHLMAMSDPEQMLHSGVQSHDSVPINQALRSSISLGLEEWPSPG